MNELQLYKTSKAKCSKMDIHTTYTKQKIEKNLNDDIKMKYPCTFRCFLELDI